VENSKVLLSIEISCDCRDENSDFCYILSFQTFINLISEIQQGGRYLILQSSYLVVN